MICQDLLTDPISRRDPILKDFCQRLLANGKVKKLALTALTRKLITLANRLLKNPHLLLRLKTVADLSRI